MKKLPKFKTKQEAIDYFVEQKSDAMAKLKMADFALYPEMFDKKPVLKEVKEEEREKAIKIAKKAAKTVNWDLLGLDDKLLMRQLEGQYFKASLSI